MKELEPPLRRHTLGKLPSHATTDKVYEAFSGFTPEMTVALLTSMGYLGDSGKPTKKAANEGVLDKCSGKFIWNLSELEKKFKKGLPNVKRTYSNQELIIRDYTGESYVTLTDIAVRFNVTPRQVGKWLDELGLRDEKGLPTKEVLKSKLAIVENFKTVGNRSKQTRKSGFWEVKQTCELLMSKGHPLDFDYEKSLEGKGKNSSVEVKENAVAERVAEFSKEFAKLYNAKDREAIRLVNKTPKLILNEAEKLLKKPGLFSKKAYLKRLEG